MVRNHSTAAVLGLIVSDINFNFLCFVHSTGFCFLQVWCPSVFCNIRTLCPITFWSPGNIVLLGVQNMCNIANCINMILSIPQQ